MGYRGYAEANGFIVSLDNTGDFTSIQAAIDAAPPGTDIFIKPQTYVENITMKGGVNLVAFNVDAPSFTVILVGKITFTTTGLCSISGIAIEDNGDYAIEITGANASQLQIIDCQLALIGHAFIHYTSSSSSSFLSFDNCSGIITANFALFTCSSAGTLFFTNCEIGHTVGVPITATSTIGSTGFISFDNSRLNFPIVYSSSATGSHIVFCSLDCSQNNATCVALTSGAILISDTYFASGTAPCLNIGVGAQVPLTLSSFFSSNANPITGAGQLNYGVLVFQGTGNGVNVTTQFPMVVRVGNIMMTASQSVRTTVPGGYPYTIVPDQDYIILADSSGGIVTVKLPATPNGGDSYVVKDATGSSETNTITVDGNGNNIDGAATLDIINGYASITFVFNGTQWNAI